MIIFVLCESVQVWVVFWFMRNLPLDVRSNSCVYTSGRWLLPDAAGVLELLDYLPLTLRSYHRIQGI